MPELAGPYSILHLYVAFVCTTTAPQYILIMVIIIFPPPSSHYTFVIRFQLISDLDEFSKVDDKNEYQAILRTGELVRTLKKLSNEDEPINANSLDSYVYSIEVNVTCHNCISTTASILLLSFSKRTGD